MIFSVILFIFSVVLSSTSQILLKISANKKHKRLILEYTNTLVLIAYFIFFISLLLTMISYKRIPLSLGLMLDSTGYIYITILSGVILKEKVTKKKIIGITLIIIGIFVTTIK